jgi:hypothetical protein
MIKEEWNAIISAKLKEGISIDDLKHEYTSGISLEPNVLGSDLEAYNHSVVVNEPWINMAWIKGGSSIEKNSLALQALEQGANGLSIELAPQDSTKDILKGILTSYLDVRITCDQLSADEIIAQKAKVNDTEYPNVRWVSENGECHEILISEDNRIDSIKSCLGNINDQTSTDIVITLGKKLLFEIASLRAIRALMDERDSGPYRIICKYEVDGTNELGDYNLIEKTYKIMSAILGGANTVLTPYIGDEDSRLTLNIHNVLDLESGMKSVMDPLGGAFYIEKLTGEIIRQVKNDA